MTICYVPPLFSSILLKVESEIWEAKSGPFWHFGPIWELGTFFYPQDYSEFGWVPASGTIFTVCLDGCPPLGILTVWDLYPDFSASTENFKTVFRNFLTVSE